LTIYRTMHYKEWSPFYMRWIRRFSYYNSHFT